MSNFKSAGALVFTLEENEVKVLTVEPKWSQNFNFVFHDLQKQNPSKCLEIKYLKHLTFDEKLLLMKCSFEELWNIIDISEWKINSWDIDLNQRKKNAENNWENFQKTLKNCKVNGTVELTLIKGTLNEKEAQDVNFLSAVLREIREESGLTLNEQANYKITYDKEDMVQYIFYSPKKELESLAKDGEIKTVNWLSVQSCDKLLRKRIGDTHRIMFENFKKALNFGLIEKMEIKK
jgi:ADP-ribose pyrophosphatase YjhB (NUDIX family)